MSVTCPRCHAQCGDDDLYCFNCGTSLTGVPRGSEPGDVARSDDDQTFSAASTWPTERGREPVDSTSSVVPSTPSPPETAQRGDPEFVPLQLDAPGRGGEGARRLLLVGLALLLLIVAGGAAALVWTSDDEDPEAPLASFDSASTREDRPEVVATPGTVATPAPATPALAPETATDPNQTSMRSVSLATPSPTDVPAARSTVPPQSSTPTATTEPSPTATAEPRPRAEPTATVAPVSTVPPIEDIRRIALSEITLLPSDLLSDLAGDAATATPRAASTPGGNTAPVSGDGTGGVVLVPERATELPDNGPAPQTLAPDRP